MISEAEKKNLRIGFKQVLRALSAGQAQKVFLAEDCEDKIKLPVEEKAAQFSVPVFYTKTMKELGGLCGIDVGASCAAVLAE